LNAIFWMNRDVSYRRASLFGGRRLQHLVYISLATKEAVE